MMRLVRLGAGLLSLAAALPGCSSPSGSPTGIEAPSDTTAAMLDTLGTVAHSQGEPVPAVPDTLALPFHPIPGLHTLAPASGRFNTRGYVIAASAVCPPCPPGAQCTPCVPTFITLAVNPDVVPVDFQVRNAAPDQIRIRTDDPQGFRIGGAYAVSINVLARSDKASPRGPLTYLDVVLLGATPLP